MNGGGTGSIETTVGEGVVTEVAAGSGLFAPALFDGYDELPAPPRRRSSGWTSPAVRAPASSPSPAAAGAAPDRRDATGSPSPPTRRGCACWRAEGAGEVQTPLTGRGTRSLGVGDRVWFRHAKAGELCERVDHLHLVAGRRGRLRGAHLPRRGPDLPLTSGQASPPNRSRV